MDVDIQNKKSGVICFMCPLNETAFYCLSVPSR